MKILLWGRVWMIYRKSIGWRKNSKHWAANGWPWYLGAKRSVTYVAPKSCIRTKAKLNNSCRSWRLRLEKWQNSAYFMWSFSKSLVFEPILLLIPNFTHQCFIYFLFCASFGSAILPANYGIPTFIWSAWIKTTKDHCQLVHGKN